MTHGRLGDAQTCLSCSALLSQSAGVGAGSAESPGLLFTLMYGGRMRKNLPPCPPPRGPRNCSIADVNRLSLSN